MLVDFLLFRHLSFEDVQSMKEKEAAGEVFDAVTGSRTIAFGNRDLIGNRKGPTG